MAGPSAAKLAPYREGTFAQASASLAGQVVSALTLIAVGFAIAWLMGREWADRTFGSLFSLPVTRTQIARAKLAVVATWAAASVTVSMILVTVGIAIFGDGSLNTTTATSLVKVWIAGLATAALALTFAWVAVASRGYLGAVGAIVGVTALSQVLASVGFGSWIPFVVPALWAGAGGPDAAAAIGVTSLAIVVGFVALGLWASVRAFGAARLD